MDSFIPRDYRGREILTAGEKTVVEDLSSIILEFYDNLESEKISNWDSDPDED